MSRLALVIGHGEIGAPIFEMLVDAYSPGEVFWRDIQEPDWHHSFKFLHICFPQTIEFTEQIAEYTLKYHPEAIIIHSTIHPGTTLKLNAKITRHFDFNKELNMGDCNSGICYYSPVRGNLKDGMKWSLSKYTKYMSKIPETQSVHLENQRNLQRYLNKIASDHLAGAFPEIKIIDDSTSLEYAKILDLCWYGLNIAFYQELERIAEDHDYDLIREFIESTPEESEGKVPRVVYYGGHIGGHCVIPAIEKMIADKSSCSFGMMLRAIIESNARRERELSLWPHKLLGKR